MSPDARPDLLSLTPDRLRETLDEHFRHRGQPGYRTDQVVRWIYEGLAASFAEMTNLPAEERDALDQAFVLDEPAAAAIQKSADGTVKHLWKLR